MDAVKPHLCTAIVCDDGKVHDGTYCGIGSCNPNGCQCKGGCHKGDALTNFKQISGFDDVSATSWLNPTLYI